VARISRQPTGVIGLDAVIDGGYPGESIIIVIGSPLSGIDHIARQFWKVEEEGGSYMMIDSEVEEGMVDARALTPDSFPACYKGKRIIVDSLSSVILNFGIDEALRCLQTARKEAAREKRTIMFLLYNNIHKPEDENRIYRLADVVLELKVVTFVTEVERQLAVHKLRQTNVPKRLIPFNITDKGIELSTTSRVV
jgi:KaiC/GvpD/RAD55 family RecA-like ATPase